MQQVTTVLFVDDEPWILRGIRRALQGAAFDVVTIESAQEALDVMRRRPIDVLVSDIDMPQMTGLELVEIVRREFPATLRMLLTGAGTLERTLAAINEGEVHRFFAKPLDVDLFRATMKSLVERIDKLRRDGDHDARRTRRDAFYGWVEDAYPGTLAVELTDAGEVILEPSLDELQLLDSERLGSF